MPPDNNLNTPFLGEWLERWISWGERTFKTDLRFLISGGFWSTVGQVASSLAALVLSVALSHWVPKAEYGEYKYVLAFVAVLGSFCLNGMSTAVFISTARGLGRALPEGFTTSLLSSVLVFLGALGIGGYYLFAGNEVLGITIFIGGLLAPFLTSANLYNSFLAGKKDFRRQSLYGIVGTVLPALGILVTAFFAPTALAITLAYFIGNTIVTLFLYYYTLKIYNAAKDPRDPEMVRYAWHQSAMGILSTFTGNIDQLFLFHYVGAVEVAIYNFATGVLDQSKGPLKALDSMVQTRFAVQKTRTIRESMNNKMFWLFITSIIVVVVYYFAAPFIYMILFPAYISAVAYSQVYAISMLALGVTPLASYLNAKKKVKEQYASTIVNSLIQIIAIVGGILLFGLWGLIWARVIIRLLGAVVTYVLYESAVRNDIETIT